LAPVQGEERRTERGVGPRGETISPDRGRLQSHEVGEEARNPRGAGDLLGDTPLPTYFNASKVRGEGSRPRAPRPREKRRRREAARASLEGGWNPPTRLLRCSLVWERPHPVRGASQSFGPCSDPSGEEHASVLVAGAGQSGLEAWEEKASEGQKPRRGATVGLGQLRPARTDSEEEQGFEVGEAGGTGDHCRSGPG